jgi:hypothetical protein
MNPSLVETLVAFVFLGAVLALVVWLIRRIRTTGRVVVGEEIALGGTTETADARIHAALEGTPGIGYRFVGPQLHLCELRRIPVWVVVVLMGAFPVGLVLMFLVRESVTMHIHVLGRDEGAVARLTGHSEQHVLDRVRTALVLRPG